MTNDQNISTSGTINNPLVIGQCVLGHSLMSFPFADEAIVLKTYDVGEADRFCVLFTRQRGKLAARANGVRRLNSRRSASLLPLQRVQLTMRKRSSGQYFISSAANITSHSDAGVDLPTFGCVSQAIELLLHFLEEGGEAGDIYQVVCEFLDACRSGGDDALLYTFILKLLSLLGTLPSAELSAVSHRSLSHVQSRPRRGALSSGVAPKAHDVPRFSPQSSGNKVTSMKSVVTESGSSHPRTHEEQSLVYHPHTGGISFAYEQESGRSLSDSLHTFLLAVPKSSLLELQPLARRCGRDIRTYTQLVLGNQLGLSLKSPPVVSRLSPAATPIW